MKKILSLMVCLSIFASFCVSVNAADTKGIEDTLSAVKQRIDTTEYDKFTSSYYTDDNGETEYSFDWSREDEDGERDSLAVAVKKNVIISYYKNSKNMYDNEDFTMSPTEAKAIAEEFLKKINPATYKDIEICENDNEYINGYSFDYELVIKHNDVPVISENGYLSVSKTLKEVCSYHMDYTGDIKFDDSKAIISIDEAQKAYKEQNPLTLQYAINRSYKDNDTETYLRYANDTDTVINANTGEAYKIPTIFCEYYAAAKNSAEDEAMGRSEFTQAELDEADRISNILSKDEALKIIKNNKVIKFNSSLKLTWSALQKDYFNPEKRYYSFYFDSKNDYLNVTIDATNGEILSFYKTPEYEEAKKHKEEKEKADAQKAFSELAPSLSKCYEFVSSENGTVAAKRYENDTEVSGDSAYFEFDSRGNLTSYHVNYTEGIEFPSKNGILTADEAFEKAVEGLDFKLCYVCDRKTKTAAPIYAFVEKSNINNFYLDAFDGGVIDGRGEKINKREAITYNDIDNHYGKDIFLKLAEYGIGFEGGELLPDKEITQAEFINLLSKIFGYSTDIDNIYRSFISSGIINKDERDDAGTVTRENAAVYIIRGMGAQAYAEMEDIYAAPFNDVEKNKGYIGILKGMKVMSGDGNGNFRPNSTVTRGEALIIIYKYLNK